MPHDAPHRILAAQAKFNRSTAGSWETFASHRAEIANLLEPVGGSRGETLCVLGAGNCNDLDLCSLRAAYDGVHLLDIDGPALDAAAKRQGVAGSPGIFLHGGIDLTGIAETLSTWSSRKPSAGEIRGALRRAATAAPLLAAAGGPFDVVLSPCVLSQIVGYAGDVLGRDHPAYRDLLVTIRDRHLRLLVELTRPGGTGLLVCDMLSSDSFAELAATKRDKLPALMDRMVCRGDFFPGLAPSAAESVFRNDPLIAPLLSDVRPLRPWVWQLTPVRTFLVYAIRVRRTAGTLLLPLPGTPGRGLGRGACSGGAESQER
jgi:hypothetical protein